jgi:hypothetical protein
VSRVSEEMGERESKRVRRVSRVLRPPMVCSLAAGKEEKGKADRCSPGRRAASS